jgi:hypothetical protein
VSPNARGYTGAALVVRSIGFGFLSGAALGVASLVLLGLDPWCVSSAWEFVGDLVLLGLYAAPIGSVIGTFVGLCCGIALAVAGPAALGRRRSVQRIAGIAAGTPFVLLAAIAAENGGQPWGLSGWLWWLLVAPMAAATGAAIGPHVVGGGADPLSLRHSCFRHCRLTRSVRQV